MALEIKNGVRMKGLTPQLVIGIVVAEGVFSHYGRDCVVTSLNDSEHMKGSKHYEGNGVDFRVRHLDGNDSDLKSDDLAMAKLIVSDLKDSLGQDFDVLLEGNHIHMEYDPKGA